MSNVTTDLIINTLKEWVENKVPIPPERYLDGALKLNILIQNEQDKHAELEQKCAELEVSWIEKDKTSAEAKARVKTSPVWLEMKKQESKVKMIVEYIRLAKKYSTTINDQLRSGL